MKELYFDSNNEKYEEHKPSIIEKIKNSFNKVRNRVRNQIEEIETKTRIEKFKKENSNSYKHFVREMEAVGYDLNQKEEDPNKWIQENLMELLYVFSKQGHSGFSAPYCINMFQKLARFEPLGPLTGKDSEWNEISEDLFQNKRSGNVFKNTKTNEVYDINGKIFRNQHGNCFTCNKSRTQVIFPYTPKSEYVNVIEDENGDWKEI